MSRKRSKTAGEELLSELFESHFAGMCRVAGDTLIRYGQSRDQAEDAAQNAFLRIMPILDRLDQSDPRRLRAYLYTIAGHEAIRICEKSGRITYLPDEDLEFIAADRDGDPPDSDVLERLRELDDRYRIPLYLQYVEEMTPKAIAGLLSLPLSTVYTLLRRGLALLRQSITQEGGNLHEK